MIWIILAAALVIIVPNLVCCAVVASTEGWDYALSMLWKVLAILAGLLIFAGAVTTLAVYGAQEMGWQ